MWAGRLLDRSCVRLCLAALTAMLLALWTGPAAARSFRTELLTEQCRVEAPATATLQKVLPRLGACDAPAPRDAVGTIWVSYHKLPGNGRLHEPWRIEVDNHRVSESIELWLVGTNGRTKRTVYDPNARTREWSSANYLSMLVLAEFPIERIVLRLHRAENRTYIRAPRVTPARAYATNDRNAAAGYGIAVGVLGVTILFHLTLFFAIRRSFQLIYCLHVGLMLAYALGYSGLSRLVLPALTATEVSKLVNFTMVAGTATGLAFVFDFLGRTTFPRAMRLWALVAGGLSAISAVLLVTVPPEWSANVYTATNLVGLHTILFAAGALGWAALRGQRMAAVLAMGWALPMSVSLLYPARNFGLIAADRLPDGLMLLAVTLECLILSVPVAARIRQLRMDHERAAERHAVLERQAQTDALTGLANRRGFGEALTQAAAAHAEPWLVALLVIDIDHFKRVNDVHGHGVGDAILQAVAAHVRRVAGDGAIVARMGGEEFLVALRNHDLARAGTIAERIRQTLPLSLAAGEDLPPVTISLGVAAGLSDQLEQLIDDADCALYRAKNEGRNRVMLADGPLMYAAAA